MRPPFPGAVVPPHPDKVKCASPPRGSRVLFSYAGMPGQLSVNGGIALTWKESVEPEAKTGIGPVESSPMPGRPGWPSDETLGGPGGSGWLDEPEGPDGPDRPDRPDRPGKKPPQPSPGRPSPPENDESQAFLLFLILILLILAFPPVWRWALSLPASAGGQAKISRINWKASRPGGWPYSLPGHR